MPGAPMATNVWWNARWDCRFNPPYLALSGAAEAATGAIAFAPVHPDLHRVGTARWHRGPERGHPSTTSDRCHAAIGDGDGDGDGAPR